MLLALARWPAPSVVPGDATRSGNAPEQQRSYNLTRSWPAFPPDLVVGAGTGVAVDSAGFVWLLHRGGRPFTNDRLIDSPTLLRIDPSSGAVVNAIGANLLASPHGLAIDADDNLWITDVMLNKVFKLGADGTLLMTIGREHSLPVSACIELRTILVNLPCPLADDHFARPTDVAVARDGTVYVSDGYRNSRIARFDPAGQFLGSWGQLGNGSDDVYLPHGLALDADGRLYLADRRNARVQVRSASGEVISTWQGDGIGRPFGVEVSPQGAVFIADGGDVLDEPTAPPRTRIVSVADGGRARIEWSLHGDAVSSESVGHDIAVGQDGSLYLAVLDRHALYKLSPAE